MGSAVLNHCFFTFQLQSVIFHIEAHPDYPLFVQCVTFNFFPSHAHELAYNAFNFITIYVFPLIVIIISYALILKEINLKTKEHRGTGLISSLFLYISIIFLYKCIYLINVYLFFDFLLILILIYRSK